MEEITPDATVLNNSEIYPQRIHDRNLTLVFSSLSPKLIQRTKIEFEKITFFHEQILKKVKIDVGNVIFQRAPKIKKSISQVPKKRPHPYSQADREDRVRGYRQALQGKELPGERQLGRAFCCGR